MYLKFVIQKHNLLPNYGKQETCQIHTFHVNLKDRQNGSLKYFFFWSEYGGEIHFNGVTKLRGVTMNTKRKRFIRNHFCNLQTLQCH